MPGILPMKVIKVGNTAQSRIAQACDRCRSKKIRCDGVRPTCSQCSSVGFECRTSDKLSRRAFPRGYTESLEERVRALETEVRELKDLLDEKDEKIDMLSRMHGNRRSSSMLPSASPSGSPESKEASPPKEDTFHVQASPLLLGVDNSDSYFMGPSSGRTFIEAFKRRIQETGKPCFDFTPEAFLHIQGTPPLTKETLEKDLGVPPRLFSDRCVNVYFQEWAPLFPVLHKPTFLRIYEEFVADPAKVKSSYKNAQLYLVFSIAGLSQESPDLPQIAACERQWSRALEPLLMENTMETLQCLIMALMYSTLRADYKKIQHYKGIAVGLSHRLGLHQSQKRFSFGALTTETRKKVFWTLYTLDCFTAATSGLPKLLREEDVQAEYPSDTDDEYVTEKGFQPTLPGEFTRLSSALALFRAARILARVLGTNYPTSSAHELSLQRMDALASELDTWYDDLPGHLRLNFAQGKPSTDVTGSRSPLLALAYHYIRTLIYRPAVGSSLGQKAAPSLLSISDSSKHIVQIVELLDERRMIFSFCFNRDDLLMLCGMSLLYQVIDLKKDSKLMRENERLVNSVIDMVERPMAPGSYELRQIAKRLIAVSGGDKVAAAATTATTTTTPPSRDPSVAVPSPQPSTKSRRSRERSVSSLGQQSVAESAESDLMHQQENMRRMTMPNLAERRSDMEGGSSRQSFDSLPPEKVARQREHRYSVPETPGTLGATTPHVRPNLDYLSLNTTPSQSGHPSPPQNSMRPPSSVPSHHDGSPMAHGQLQASKFQPPVSNAEWEMMLGTMDGGLNNVYDAIYGGRGFVNEATIPSATPPQTGSTNDWSPDTWDLSNFNIGEFGSCGVGPGTGSGVDGDPTAPQSVLSLSDETLSSGSAEDVAPSELGLSLGSVDYQGNMVPGNRNDRFLLDGLDTFPL